MPFSRSFQRQPYSVVGDSFASDASEISSQSTINLIAEPIVNGINNVGVLRSFPGLALWSSGATGDYDRGIHKQLFKGKGWKVSGNTLYSFDSLGTQTNEGTVGGSGRVSMEDNGNVLFIVASGVAYTHNGTSLSTLSLSFTPSQVAYLNERFIVLDNLGNVHLSDVGTTNFGAEIPFQAKSSSDATVGIHVFDQFLFVGGENTFEPWQDVGTGNPPFARVNGVIIEDVGLANKNCFCSTPSALYFLSADNLPYKIVSFQARDISETNPSIYKHFSSYDKTAAYLTGATVRGQKLIFYVFPNDGKMWAYSDKTGLWFELYHDVNKSRYLGSDFVFLFKKTLVSDRQNGDLYELSTTTYTNNSVNFLRERTFKPLAGESLGAPRANFQMKCMQLAVNTGVGVSDDNPQLQVSISTDGGRNFSNQQWINLGEEGDYLKNIEYYSNAKFKDLTVKVKYTENTALDLYDSAMWIREAGR